MKLQDILNDEDERYYFFRHDNSKLIYFKKNKFIFRFPEKDYLRSIESQCSPEGIETLEIFYIQDCIFNVEEILSEVWVKVK